MIQTDFPEWPRWRFRRAADGKIEQRLFEAKEDESEGWFDSPAKVPEADETETVASEGEPQDIDAMTRKELFALAKARGLTTGATIATEDLRALLKE